MTLIVISAINSSIMMYALVLGIDSKWQNLIPLVVINVLMLTTVVIFAFIRRKRGVDEELASRAHSKWLGPFFFEYWGWFITPIENLFIRLNFSPNLLTTFGFILSLASGMAFATGHFGLAGWLLIIGGTFDMFDGRVARRTGRTSKSGAFYDSVMDRFAEAVTLFGLAYFYQSSWVLYVVIAALVGSTMVSYTRAKGDSIGIDCKVGPMQRPERIVYLGVGSIFSPPFRHFFFPNAAEPVEYLAIAALILIAVMTFITAIYRMIYITRKINISEGKKPKESSSPLVRKLTHRFLDI